MAVRNKLAKGKTVVAVASQRDIPFSLACLLEVSSGSPGLWEPLGSPGIHKTGSPQGLGSCGLCDSLLTRPARLPNRAFARREFVPDLLFESRWSQTPTNSRNLDPGVSSDSRPFWVLQGIRIRLQGRARSATRKSGSRLRTGTSRIGDRKM